MFTCWLFHNSIQVDFFILKNSTTTMFLNLDSFSFIPQLRLLVQNIYKWKIVTEYTQEHLSIHLILNGFVRSAFLLVFQSQIYRSQFIQPSCMYCEWCSIFFFDIGFTSSNAHQQIVKMYKQKTGGNMIIMCARFVFLLVFFSLSPLFVLCQLKMKTRFYFAQITKKIIMFAFCKCTKTHNNKTSHFLQTY